MSLSSHTHYRYNDVIRCRRSGLTRSYLESWFTATTSFPTQPPLVGLCVTMLTRYTGKILSAIVLQDSAFTDAFVFPKQDCPKKRNHGWCFSRTLHNTIQHQRKKNNRSSPWGCMWIYRKWFNEWGFISQVAAVLLLDKGLVSTSFDAVKRTLDVSKQLRSWVNRGGGGH